MESELGKRRDIFTFTRLISATGNKILFFRHTFRTPYETPPALPPQQINRTEKQNFRTQANLPLATHLVKSSRPADPPVGCQFPRHQRLGSPHPVTEAVLSWATLTEFCRRRPRRRCLRLSAGTRLLSEGWIQTLNAYLRCHRSSPAQRHEGCSCQNVAGQTDTASKVSRSGLGDCGQWIYLG